MSKPPNSSFFFETTLIIFGKGNSNSILEKKEVTHFCMVELQCTLFPRCCDDSSLFHTCCPCNIPHFCFLCFLHMKATLLSCNLAFQPCCTQTLISYLSFNLDITYYFYILVHFL